MAGESRAREAVVGAAAAVLLAASFYFLLNSLALMTQQPPRVAASLLAALIGLATLASSVTLFRVWLLSRMAEQRRGEEGGGGKP